MISQFAQIILPLGNSGTFTYKLPVEIAEKVVLGMRVLVPFRGKKIYTGIISELHNNAPEHFLAKEVIALLDERPILALPTLEIWQWMAEYYLCNLGDIYRMAFPSSLKLESETYLKLNPGVVPAYENLEANEIYLMQALEVKQLINLTEIEAFIPKKNIINTINSLIDLQYIIIDEKVTEKYKSKEVLYVKIKDERWTSNDFPVLLQSLSKSPKQKEILLKLLALQTQSESGFVKKADLHSQISFSASQYKALLDKALIEEFSKSEDRIAGYEGHLESVESLSDAQILASQKIQDAFEEEQPVLLHGVTSSGKTHVYLDQIEKCIARGKNVLFLLPELALTKQIIQRLEKKYGTALGYYHQKNTDFEKVELWRKVLNNSLKIIVGTKNALFLPYQNLGLIIVDEEHDSAYKNRDSVPYYSAKDTALVLAKKYHASLILGSATPSLESYYYAKKGVLWYVYLPERFGGIALPKFEIINLKQAQETKNSQGNFSFILIDELKNILEDEKQALILHNRRGYANVVECQSCGYVTYCTNCDVVMTYHKAAHEMKCHYCGQKSAKPIVCPKCHSENLTDKGIGVEQIHEEIQKIIPNARVDRMDLDAMRKKFAYEKIFEKIQNKEVDFVVGTQMISKGLDFDSIELVAIPKADSLLYVQDYRAEERAYQLITQVSGRAGRTSGKGKVLIQTYHPEHKIFELIQKEDPSEIYQYLIEERKKFNYPPFVKLVMIEMKHRKEDKLNRAAQYLGNILRKYLPEVCVFGPEVAPVARINTLYQYQIMLKLPKGKKYATYKDLVHISLNEFDEVEAYKSVKKYVKVDF